MKAKSKVQSLKSKVRSCAGRRPAAVERLASFLSVWLILALLATGCAGPRPLKGGRAVTMHKPAGVIEQTLVQGENPSQATKQDQETVKVRSYTVPAGSRMELSPASGTAATQPASARPELSTLNSQPSSIGALGSAFLLAKKLLSHKPVKPELVSRAEFCAEMLATRERLHTNHLAILEKLDANHRELLAALERLATRISALEAGLARVDERTRK